MTSKEAAEALMQVFRGSDKARGETRLTQTRNSKGKLEARCVTIPQPPSLENWVAHVEGHVGLGVPPITSESTVYFGAIDIDVYGEVSFPQMNDIIHRHGLPLVLCRSKSGGPHIFLFVSEPVPAKLMMEKLEMIAAFLGYGTSEIFPKQAMIGQNDGAADYGSWINMPYFGGVTHTRYGFDRTGQAILDIGTFVGFCRSQSLTMQALKDYKTPEPEQILPDGPPCLNRLYAEKPTEFRNVILSNTAVYLRRVHGEGWAEHLETFNQKFDPPLPRNEVEAITKSYGKKEYRYQCSKQPMCAFCNSTECKKTKHGIGGRELLPDNRSLSMLKTNPPIWFLDITLTNGVTKRISLTTEELQTQRLFQRRCMEVLQQMPGAMKPAEWEEIVAGLMRHVSIIEIPRELTPEGQLIELLFDWLTKRSDNQTMEALVQGKPFTDEDFFYFRMKDFMSILSMERFNSMKQNHISSVLTTELSAQKDFRKIAGVGVNYLRMPKPKDRSAPTITPLHPEVVPF